MPKPQVMGKVMLTDQHEAPGWRVVLVCRSCARHFMVPEAEAPDVRFCPWCGATE